MKKLFVIITCLLFIGATYAQRSYSGFVKTWDENGTDCCFDWTRNSNFNFYGETIWYTDFMSFHTLKELNNVNGDPYYKFRFKVIPTQVINSSRAYNDCVKGNVYIQTKDGAKHLAFTYTRQGSKGTCQLSYNKTDDKYGVYDITTDLGGFVEITFLPTHKTLNLGFNGIYIQNEYYVNDGYWGAYQYRKTISEGLRFNYQPLPKPTYSWNHNAGLLFTIQGVPSTTKAQNYTVTFWKCAAKSDNTPGEYVESTYPTYDMQKWGHKNASGTLDASFPIGAGSFLTKPIVVRTMATEDVELSSNLKTSWLSYIYEEALTPFTSPKSINVQFNQWTKKTTITWEANKSSAYSIPSGGAVLTCRTDGKWYVLRWLEDGTPNPEVTIVDSLDGPSSNLKVLDNALLEYDNRYTYRVLFLPSIMENYDRNKLKEIAYGLYKQRTISTERDVPIRLTQDRTEESGIKLVWDYSILEKGNQFRVDRRAVGGMWESLTDIPVETDETKASYIDKTASSPCEFYDYRIVVNCIGMEFESKPLTANLPAGTYIKSVKASKGTQEGNVVVEWTVEQRGTDDTYFKIMRKPIGAGENGWVEIANTKGTASEYTYTDDRIMIGTYYEYSVVAYGSKCDAQVIQTDRKIDAGFSQAKGTITGHIAYGTGTSVADVRVNLVKSNADAQDTTLQFYSRRIEGAGDGLKWVADSARYEKTINNNQPLTISLWVLPDMYDKPYVNLFSMADGVWEVGIKTENDTLRYLYSREYHNGQEYMKEYPKLRIPNNTFTYIAATHFAGSKWKFYVGVDSLECDSVGGMLTYEWGAGLSEVPFSFGGSNHLYGEHFAGYVDDIRIWGQALTAEEIQKNYTRLLSGSEGGLILYWPLDEGLDVTNYAFDVSRQDGLYNQNHAIVGINTKPSQVIPAKLKLYGITDIDGNYIIRGIPFSSGGTNYKILPELGIHSFNPSNRSLFVSPTSLTANNVDFKDESSFPMTGYVYYAGTNIPAEGLQLYIDGDILTMEGEVITTDAEGRYTISVPIGEHYVEAKLNGHKMANGGRFPIKGKFDFNRSMQYDFEDSTLVNFSGRIVGGDVEGGYPIGFGASKNNIGVSTLQLGLTNESLSFNCLEDHISDNPEQRSFASNTSNINSTTYAGAGSKSKYIYIKTDPKTGEFSAMIPPLKYQTRNISVDNNDKAEFYDLPEIDLTSVLKEVKDSLLIPNPGGDSTYHYYKYNTKMVRVYYSEPKLEVVQNDNEYGAFGVANITNFEDTYGKIDTVHIYSVDTNTSEVNYVFGYPVYQMGSEHTFELRGYETYTNYDVNPAVVDEVPLKAQALTIKNEMSADQKIAYRVEDPEKLGLKVGDVVDLKNDQIALDKEGKATYTWTTGMPSIVSPYTRNMHITYVRQDRTYLWEGINAIVFGNMPTGNNFVTLGPDKVTMVLRDPPGAKSKTTWKRGTTKTKVNSVTNGYFGDEKFQVEGSYGIYVETSAGVGVEVVTTKLKETIDGAAGVHVALKKTKTTEQIWSTTATQSISTSSDENYVGHVGDVFIGASTNLLVGDCRKVGLFRNGPEDTLYIDLAEAKSMSDSIRTTFLYTTFELESVMIPKWKSLRDGMLSHIGSEAEAKAYVNTTNNTLYLTWLNESDDNYGKKDTYIQVPPANWDGSFLQDSVLWCNDQINSWKQILSSNEQDKVKAMQNRGEYWNKNISFDGGDSYDYTSRCDTSYQVKHDYTHNLGGLLKVGGTSSNEVAGISIVVKPSLETENGWVNASSKSDEDENYKDFAELEYTLSDGHVGMDLSVDIYKSPMGWSDIFSVFGGQTYCPYEDEVRTKYYEEGQHVLSAATVQIDRPQIRIGIGDEVPAMSAVKTDIPSGTPTTFKLYITNSSDVKADMYYILSASEDSNEKGLILNVDGLSLSSGRSIFVPGGQTVVKTLEVSQTDPSILNYEDVKIKLTSQCQKAENGIFPAIMEHATLSVYFTPSSSPVDLVVSNPVLNTDTDGKLNLKLTNFNRHFKNLKNLGIEYRYEGNPNWTVVHYYVLDKADSTDASYSVLPATNDVKYVLDMINDVSYPNGTYTFRAFTTTPYGTTDNVRVYSDEVTVVKDMKRPIALTTPTPTNGLLGFGDYLSVEFNEDIIPAYVTDNNIIVTAKVNDQPINHEVAVGFEGEYFSAFTLTPIFLDGDFTLDMWMKYSQGGTLIEQGYGQNTFALRLDEQGHLVIDIANTSYTSKATLPTDKWMYMVLAYDAENMSFTVKAFYDTESVLLFDKQKVDSQATTSYMYSMDNTFYLGGDGLKGAMHDLCLYNIYIDVDDAASEKDVPKTGYQYGLADYWPMNEGYGTLAADTRLSHDLYVMPNSWVLNNKNYALSISKEDNVGVDISRSNTQIGDSYAVELWYRCKDEVDSSSTIFETGSRVDNSICLHFDNERNLALTYAGQSRVVVPASETPFFYGWNHIALNVIRGSSAIVYFNGQRTAVIAERDVPSLEGATLRLGKDFACDIDEIRIWKANISQSALLSNMYNCIDTSAISAAGLIAYFPMEKTDVVDGITTKVPTLDNMVARKTNLFTSGRLLLGGNATGNFTEDTPPLKNAPELSRLTATPVASERKIMINLQSAPKEIERTTLNITVDKVYDVHGNQSLPIRWQAFVNQNTLIWEKDEMLIEKMYGADVYFDTKIFNLSGITENYTITNMPWWMSIYDGKESDVLNPISNRSLTFMIDRNMPVGNYEVSLNLVGNNEINETFRIVVKVKGEMPQWSVDPTQFENSMSVVGQIIINGILCESTESRVAAFVDGECRGIAAPEKMRESAYVPMTIYGNLEDEGKPIVFRIWDASTGLVYNNVKTSEVVAFNINQTIGTFDYPLVWTKSDEIEQTLAINRGWNWISLAVDPIDKKPATVFENLTPFVDHIKTKTSGVAYCDGEEWSGTLDSIAGNVMYKMLLHESNMGMGVPMQTTVVGKQLKSADHPVTLSPGWNWIGCISSSSQILATALAGANPQEGDCIKSQTAFAIYGPFGWEGNLKAVEAGRGYMYYSADDVEKQFTYPIPTKRTNGDVEVEKNLHIFQPVDGRSYPDNMIAVIQVVDGEDVVDTLELAAYVADECRAAARAIDGLYYLVVPGEGVHKSMEIRTQIHGQILSIDSTIVYNSDGKLGTPWEPYVINLQGTSAANGAKSQAEQVLVYPTVTNDVVNINAPIRIKTLNLYSVEGRLLMNVENVGNTTYVDMKPYRSGMYLINILLENGESLNVRIVRK